MKSSLTLLIVAGLFGVADLAAHPGHAEQAATTPPQQTVVALQYCDFHNESCAEVSGLLKKLADGKKLQLQVIFKHAPAHPDALVAHEAVLAAGAQGRFWAMHKLLFATPKPGLPEILEMAGTLGLDGQRLQNSLDEREFRGEVMRSLAEARGLGIRVTPTVFLNGTRLEGIEQIRSFVESALAPPPEPEDPTTEYAFDLAGSPSLGPEDAPITIVEFSDFRCGYCRAHSRTLTELMEAYPGRIRRVFKHFPIRVNDEGKLPHQAAMAAMEQGKFWEMYKSLMSSRLEGLDDLVACANSVGLAPGRFQRDLAAQHVLALVERDIAEGDRHGIRSTPTTFINGRRVRGRQSLESLKTRIDSLLNPNAIRPEPAAIAPEATAVGPVDALAVFEFFVDFANSDTVRMARVLGEFQRSHPEVRIEFKHYPAGANSGVPVTHEAVMAAAAQGRFWGMCHLIFTSPSRPDRAKLLEFARQLELDPKLFAAALADHRHAAAIAADLADGNARGLQGKPGVFLNGRRLPGAVPTTDQLTASLKVDGCCDKRRAAGTSRAGTAQDPTDIFAPR